MMIKMNKSTGLMRCEFVVAGRNTDGVDFLEAPRRSLVVLV